jgi:uncharacterized protein YceK
MKIALILLAVLLSGCSTIQQAKTDFHNFKRTMTFNLGQPVVYKDSVF